MSHMPPAVRILPMDSQKEFPNWSVKKLQSQYFLEDLPFRPEGEYPYHKMGLKAEAGTVLLFQYGGRIVASATLREVRRFATPRVEVWEGVSAVYEGALYFDPSSVRVFDPVTEIVLRRIWPQITRLGRVKWSLDPKGYPTFERELKHVETPKV